MTNPMLTFQTRLDIGDGEIQALNAYAALLSRVERCLFAAWMSGKNIADLKSVYIVRFGITARQFNACRLQVEGKIASLRQLQGMQIADLKSAIEKIEAEIERLKKKKGNGLKVFWKQRRRHKLQQKLRKWQEEQENGIVHLCFGSKKLFRAQFHLEDAGYATFQDWLAAWQGARCSEFFLVGSKDETGGNQTCSASLQENGKLALRLRLPDALHEEFGKYMVVSDVEFAYGHEAIVASLEDCLERKNRQEKGDSTYQKQGQAISYRFKRDEKGWRVFASTSLGEPEWQTTSHKGVIGVDINADHLAIAETDRFGNLVSSLNIPLELYGKDTDQSLACIGEACAQVVSLALEKKKDLVIEELDFQKKRADLRDMGSARLARALSSFAYGKIMQHLKSRGWRCGVHVHQVNPAFTSVIGRVKFAERYGLSIHQAAALCIGRRFYGFSERPSCYRDRVPDGKGGHVAFSLPERNRRKHVWSLWREVKKKMRAVLAAHFRAAERRSTDPPKPVCETGILPEIAGEIPACESLALLLG